MALKSVIRKLSIVLVLVVLGTGIGLWMGLPGMIEARAPSYAKEYGIHDLSLDVRKIGLFGADISSIVIGKPDSPALTVATVQVDYTPWGLMKKQIGPVKVAGVQVHATAGESGFTLRGLDLPVSESSSDESQDAFTLPLTAPVDISTITLESTSLNLDWGGQTYRLPVEAQVAPIGRDVFRCELALYPRGHKILCQAMVDLPGQQASLSLDSESLELLRFADFAKDIPDLVARGGLDLNAKAGWSSGGLEPATASLTLGAGEIMSGPARLSFSKGNPLQAHISFHESQAKLSVKGIRLVEPVDMKIPSLDVQLALEDSGISALGKFEYLVHAVSGVPVVFSQKIQGTGNLKATHSADGNIRFELANTPAANDVVMLQDDTQVSFDQPRINVQGKGPSPDDLHVDFSLTVSDLKAEAGNVRARLPGVETSGTVALLKDQEPAIKAFTRFDKGLVIGTNPAFLVSGIEAAIPFSWPCKQDMGRISVGSMMVENKNVGPVQADLACDGLQVAFTGSHQDLLLPDLLVEFSGEAGLDESGGFQANVDFGFENHNVFSLDLERIDPALAGYIFNGTFSSNGFARMENGGVETGMHVSLKNGSIQASELDIEVTGIGLSLSMDDLIEVRSAPRQVFSFEKARVGTIEVTKGKVEFIVESATSFFVERSSFAWCNGRVYSPAVHLQAGVSDYELLLFCDRLEFMALLKQLGAVDARGSGSLNGIIPVRIKDGQFQFDDGHLYSTPGDKGTIKLKGGDTLMDGIAAGTPQHSQLTLAKLALEDYQYEYAKLGVNSEGENLIIKLQLDGKPSGPLPLVPDPKTGNFNRVESPKNGAVFQGIKLNLNIKLPFNLLMKYGIRLKDYF